MATTIPTLTTGCNSALANISYPSGAIAGIAPNQRISSAGMLSILNEIDTKHDGNINILKQAVDGDCNTLKAIRANNYLHAIIPANINASVPNSITIPASTVEIWDSAASGYFVMPSSTINVASVSGAGMVYALPNGTYVAQASNVNPPVGGVPVLSFNNALGTVTLTGQNAGAFFPGTTINNFYSQYITAIHNSTAPAMIGSPQVISTPTSSIQWNNLTAYKHYFIVYEVGNISALSSSVAYLEARASNDNGVSFLAGTNYRTDPVSIGGSSLLAIRGNTLGANPQAVGRLHIRDVNRNPRTFDGFATHFHKDLIMEHYTDNIGGVNVNRYNAGSQGYGAARDGGFLGVVVSPSPINAFQIYHPTGGTFTGTFTLYGVNQ